MSEGSKTYRELKMFIRDKMRMSQIYQPLMLSTLLSNKGEGAVSTIASAILKRDQSQIEYYGEITKNMVGKVLFSHGLTEKIKEGRSVVGYRLKGFEELSEDESCALVELCNEKIEGYLDKRGADIWSHRSRSSGYVPGTIRYEVLKRAKRCCELCGVSAEGKALQVDHIFPRSLGGGDEIENFQALCYTCNGNKGNRDNEDFRKTIEKYKDRDPDCPFCEINPQRVVAQNSLCIAVKDKYEVTGLHHLIIPKRHVEDYFGLFQPELNATRSLMGELKESIQKQDPTVTGFNIGVNCGEDAGQTIFHCHHHLIPRRCNDVENPAGGVRGVIPSKMDYGGFGGKA